MPKQSTLASMVDGKVFRFANSGNRTEIVCLICPRTLDGHLREFALKHIKSHSQSHIHQRHLKMWMKNQTTISGFQVQYPGLSDEQNHPSIPPYQICKSNPIIDEADLDSLEPQPVIEYSDHPNGPVSNLSDISPLQDMTGKPGTLHVPLSELWEATSNSRYQSLGDDWDLFQDMQESLYTNAEVFSTPFTQFHFPIHGDVAREEVFEEDHFGIEVPGMLSFLIQVLLPVEINADDSVPSSNTTRSKLFITTLLFSSPRLPFSEAQMRAVLDWAKELGARDVPSLYAIKQHQKYLQDTVGDPTTRVVSPSGNIFYVNNIANVIAKDYANPLTRFSMQDFPEDRGNGRSQVFHGDKLLHELPSPPAARVNGTIYFVDELLQDISGGYFIPECFFLATSSVASGGDLPMTEGTKELFALGRAVKRTDAGFLVSDKPEIVLTSTFKFSFEELSSNCEEFSCGFMESSKRYALLMPNPWHKKSGGRMVYRIPLIIFMDDVSGNISKQWNKHFVIYMSNASLPREMLDQEFHVHFISSSAHASPMELMCAVKESIMCAAEMGVITWDCRDEEEVFLIPNGLFHTGNNPMQAEICSQGGLNCNYFCRTCHVGGTKDYKESDSGYCTLFEVHAFHSTVFEPVV
ncbi:hypothetical protein M404DRAFT_169286 [Pisolithus tinctorius Marx 270]|uniref:Uncharacterized protein n=1 Tax=Pisolithus tinctorius Marx 270 TaxID=870435 RepID=A0A0C3J8P0_PISTI|nr:hypothetical protein M404DRAFT_169286 [Pisolithus tinctorius Marx 270]